MAAACYLLKPFVPAPWKIITADIYTMVPALFWLLCRLVFADRPRLLSLTGAIALYTFIAQAISRHLGISAEHLTQWHLVGKLIPCYCEYLLVILGMWTVISQWNDDLVESRRKPRGFQ